MESLDFLFESCLCLQHWQPCLYERVDSVFSVFFSIFYSPPWKKNMKLCLCTMECNPLNSFVYDIKFVGSTGDQTKVIKEGKQQRITQQLYWQRNGHFATENKSCTCAEISIFLALANWDTIDSSFSFQNENCYTDSTKFYSHCNMLISVHCPSYNSGSHNIIMKCETMRIL